MMKLITKWRVVVIFDSREVVLWIHDISHCNVLRSVASLQFSENGLEQPKRIVIERATEERTAS